MEWPANYTFFFCKRVRGFHLRATAAATLRRHCGGLHEAARPPLTKHDPGFNFIDRKKSLAILDYVDLAYIDI